MTLVILDLKLCYFTLRECVEKLQELSNPTFRAAKLHARPEVSADPRMGPGYESDVSDEKPITGLLAHPFRKVLMDEVPVGSKTFCHLLQLLVLLLYCIVML